MNASTFFSFSARSAARQASQAQDNSAGYGPGRRAINRLAVAALLGLAFRPGRAAAAEPFRLLAFGDSLTAGYGLPTGDGFTQQLERALRAAGGNVTVINAGVSGDTSAGGRARLAWTLATQPRAMILELGANDGLRGLDPAAMAANLTAILDECAARKLPVLLSGMKAPPNYGAAYSGAFDAVFPQLAQRPGLLFDPFFLEGVAGDPAFNQGDGIHPTAAGVARIVTRLLPLVQKLIAAA